MLDVWNDNAAIIIQVESELGSRNAEEMCAVPGVDAVMIGTGDLRLDMRLPFGFDGPEPEYQAAIARIENAAKAKGFPLFGFALGKEMMEAKLARGYKGLMVTADALAMVAGQAAMLVMCREVVKEHVEQEEKVEVNGVATKARKAEVNGVHTNEVVVNGHGQ